MPPAGRASRASDWQSHVGLVRPKASKVAPRSRLRTNCRNLYCVAGSVIFSTLLWPVGFDYGPVAWVQARPAVLWRCLVGMMTRPAMEPARKRRMARWANEGEEAGKVCRGRGCFRERPVMHHAIAYGVYWSASPQILQRQVSAIRRRPSKDSNVSSNDGHRHVRRLIVSQGQHQVGWAERIRAPSVSQSKPVGMRTRPSTRAAA
jgi:hypothetical protein